MAAPKKISDEEIEKLRGVWETDPRPGFTWFVQQFSLPISAPGMRKKAMAFGWKKTTPRVEELIADGAVLDKSSETISDTVSHTVCDTENDAAPAKVSLKVSQKHSLKKAKNKVSLKKVDETKVSHDKKPAKPLSCVQSESLVNQVDKPVGVLQDREERFVQAYIERFSVAEAARAAKFSQASAYKLMAKASVQARIREVLKPRIEKMGIDADALVNIWAKALTFDVNEIVQYRRYCCPFCYSEDGSPLLAPEEYYKEKKKYDDRRLYKPDMPEYPPYEKEWWDRSLPPKNSCPNCHGNGIGEVFIADTTKLSPFAKYMYCGVREGKDGIEVVMLNKEKAADNLAKALGLFREKEEKQEVGMVSHEELLDIYAKRMREAEEKARQMCLERGLEIEDAEIIEDGD